MSDRRPLTVREREALVAMLGIDVPGIDELRAQVDGLQVSGGCDCGCPTIYFAHPDTSPGSNHLADGSLADTNDGLLLFTSGPYLDSLEYMAIDEPTPVEFPPAAALTSVAPAGPP